GWRTSTYRIASRRPERKPLIPRRRGRLACGLIGMRRTKLAPRPIYIGAAAVYKTNPEAAMANAVGPGPGEGTDDLSPIAPADWSSDRAPHLLERAAFGATPEEIERFARMTPQAAVASLVSYQSIDNRHLKSFDHSGVHDPGLEPFPASRPAATDLAKATGEALGVRVKPEGNRRLQAVPNKFFYWLRASRLETNRVAYWWAERMLTTHRPLEEKMALFWHGHFATSEDKVRDYRKMLRQLELFQRHATGNFRDLLIGV